MPWFILLVIPLGLLLYWLLITTEGTYLGARTVERLYDWTATKYDEIKQVDPVADAWLLAEPLLAQLGESDDHLILDVATGTGRLPLSLTSHFSYGGRVVGLDRSGRMLKQAHLRSEANRRAAWLRGDAEALPFAAELFDGVTCLEAIEFFPHPRAAVEEMTRVLRPGGILLVSNRVGSDTWLLPRRYCGRGRLERLLATAGLERITTRRWQVHYDLIWCRKGVSKSHE